jgi:uncharacterized protein (TIGR00369 family)
MGAERQTGMKKPFNDNKRCFVCGQKNRDGLRLVVRMDKGRGRAAAEVVFQERFQGWEGIVHGGLLATVLDEAMIYAAGSNGLRCVTGEITVRYILPARTGEVYRLEGRVTGARGKITLAESELIGTGGEAVARATGKLFKVRASGFTRRESGRRRRGGRVRTGI